LRLEGFGVAFADKVILKEVDWSISQSGVYVLMGPGGAGKSTLLRSLAGHNEAQPAFRSWGRADYLGASLGEEGRPVLVHQKARLLISTLFENLASGLPNRRLLTRGAQNILLREVLKEWKQDDLLGAMNEEVVQLDHSQQRRVAIVRVLLSSPRLICVDEPTAELSETGADSILQLLRRIGDRLAVLLVTHNQLHARRIGDQVGLMVDGRLIEEQQKDVFFDHPRSSATKEYVRSGYCLPPLRVAPVELARPPQPAQPAPALPLGTEIAALGPRGFHWLEMGILGGVPRPGLLDDVRHDLAALRRIGVRVLVSLEEQPTVAAKLLSEVGIEGYFFPIDDMKAPSLDAAVDLCRRLVEWEQEGRVMALHCKAGLGRTGTMLVAYLVYGGLSALEGLEAARSVNARWVQSDEQIYFLEEFQHYLRPPD